MSDIKIELLNKEEASNFFKMWGLTSAVCYATDDKYAVGVGKSCMKTKHYSGGRHRYLVFRFEGISRACADQMARHSIGVCLNMRSGRYVNIADFDYHTPSLIKRNAKAKKIYDDHMKATREAYKGICEALEEDGYKGEKVNECARGVAPMAHHTKMVMGFNLEALTNFMHKRLCVCSQEEIQKVARQLKKAVVEVLPELEDELVAVCEAYLYCPESAKRSCGRYPQKSELALALEMYRKSKQEPKKLKLT